jgi:hypothetical protein
MRTIEATTLIAEDRKLVLQLPSDVTPGEHRDAVRQHREERIQHLMKQALQ